MDVNTTVLNGEIKDELYVEKSHEFNVHDKEMHACILKKYLYGLKKEPGAWYGRIENFLTILGFI